jgi:cytochrome c553
VHIPSLDLAEARFVDAMRAFRNGTRKGSVMNRIARGYAEEDIAQLARFFSRVGAQHR